MRKDQAQTYSIGNVAKMKQNAWESITTPTGNGCNANLPSSDPFSKMTDTASTDPTKTGGLVITASPFPIQSLEITSANDTHSSAKVPFVSQPGVISSFC
jgi:hypothetical protein